MKSYLIGLLDCFNINFSPDNKYVATSYTLDNFGHPKFHINKEENSELVQSFSYDSRHFISKIKNNKKNYTISCIYIKGNRRFNRKICEPFIDADYFTNDHIIVSTNDYFRYYSIENLRLLRKLKNTKDKICLSGDHSI